MTLSKLIQELLEEGFKKYITAVDSTGDFIKIRVADHRMNEKNNTGFTLSFVSGKDGKQDASCFSAYEFLVDGEYANEYQTIEQVLREYCIVSFFYNNEKINAY